jgi:5-(carboxyamino)imidazole ribonucleotide mutase
MDVAIILGSKSDMHVAERVTNVLREQNVSYDLQVISVHRNPDRLDEYLAKTDAKIIIAIAGLSAALPGIIASKLDKPVIGVPVSAKLMGLDALLSMTQLPSGVPVATVGVDSGENAALFAVRVLKILEDT